jgi:hypothetical protein
MGCLEYIAKKYSVDTAKARIELPIGRFKDIPKLFGELGFKKGAEIGVYRGLYSKWLLRYIPGLHLTGVDLWEIYTGYKDYNQSDIIEAKKEAEGIYKGKNATLIQGWSHDVVKTIPDESLDFVFIDGNHAYEYVVEDIAKWSKKVRKGGIVYGHDYDDYSTHSRRWNEMNVINAVDGWVKSYRIKPLFIITKNTNNCWMYVKA